MHRTNSVDYGIVLEGELDMELDGGEECISMPVMSSCNAVRIMHGSTMAPMPVQDGLDSHRCGAGQRR